MGVIANAKERLTSKQLAGRTVPAEARYYAGLTFALEPFYPEVARLRRRS